MQIRDGIYSPRSQYRVVDRPEWYYPGPWELSTGKRTAGTKYSRSPWAFACMQIRGSELANLPWRLVDGSGRIVEQHPLIDMLNTFGRESNYSESVQSTEIDLLMQGKAFWLRDADLLQRLNPSTIEPKVSAAGISEFVQTIDGKIVNRFDREEVVYFREYNPDNDLLPGVAVMEVVKQAVSVEYESGFYVEAFFKNDATPSVLLSTEQTVQEGEMNKVKAWWVKSFGGSKKAHKVGFADKGLKAQILSTSLRDIALVEVRDQARNDICAGMRVPKILVGAMEEATYANAQEARKFMIEDLIIPRSTYYADVINADLVQRVDPGVTFEFDPESLQIMQEDLTSKWARLDLAIQRGAISAEFARQEMGWPETAAPSVQPTPEQATLRSWAKKSKNAIKAGRDANVEFETDEISLATQAAIRSKLAGVTTTAEVDKVFANGRS